MYKLCQSHSERFCGQSGHHIDNAEKSALHPLESPLDGRLASASAEITESGGRVILDTFPTFSQLLPTFSQFVRLDGFSIGKGPLVTAPYINSNSTARRVLWMVTAVGVVVPSLTQRRDLARRLPSAFCTYEESFCYHPRTYMVVFHAIGIHAHTW